jgi:hypothetical protein
MSERNSPLERAADAVLGLGAPGATVAERGASRPVLTASRLDTLARRELGWFPYDPPASGRGPTGVALRCAPDSPPSLPDFPVYYDRSLGRPACDGPSLVEETTVRALLDGLPRPVDGPLREGPLEDLYLDLRPLLERVLRDRPSWARPFALRVLRGMSFDEVGEACGHGGAWARDLWNRRLPAEVARCARQDWLRLHADQAGIPRRTCPRCGRRLPRHPLFFGPNKGCGDGFYSICRECRRRRPRATVSEREK